MVEQSPKWHHRLRNHAETLLDRFLLAHVMKEGTVVWYRRFNAGDDGQGIILARDLGGLFLRVRDTGSGLIHYLDLPGRNPFSLLSPPTPPLLTRMRINFFKR